MRPICGEFGPRVAGGHRLVLQVVTGLAAREWPWDHGSGRWLVDVCGATRCRCGTSTKPWAKKLRPQYGRRAAQGWIRRIAGPADAQLPGSRQLLMCAPVLELNPREVTVLQAAHRWGAGRAQSWKARNDLGVEVQGPPGWRSEVWSASIPGEVRVSLNVPLQAMTCGDSYLKVEFGAGGETKQMPLLVHSQRRFPLLGTWWPQGSSVDLAGKLDAGAIQLPRVTAQAPQS